MSCCANQLGDITGIVIDISGSAQSLVLDGNQINLVPGPSYANIAQTPAILTLNDKTTNISYSAFPTIVTSITGNVEMPGTVTINNLETTTFRLDNNVIATDLDQLYVNGTNVAEPWANYTATNNVTIPADYYLSINAENTLTYYKNSRLNTNILHGVAGNVSAPDFISYPTTFQVGSVLNPARTIELCSGVGGTTITSVQGISIDATVDVNINAGGIVTLDAVGDMNVTSGAMTVETGVMNVIAGDTTITAGNIMLNGTACEITTGATTITSGATNITSGALTMEPASLDVASLGNILLTSPLITLTGAETAIQSANTNITSGNIQITGATTIVTGGLFQLNGSCPLQTDFIQGNTPGTNTIEITDVSSINGLPYPPAGVTAVTSINSQTGPAITLTGSGGVTVTTPTPNTINIAGSAGTTPNAWITFSEIKPAPTDVGAIGNTALFTINLPPQLQNASKYKVTVLNMDIPLIQASNLPRCLLYFDYNLDTKPVSYISGGAGTANTFNNFIWLDNSTGGTGSHLVSGIGQGYGVFKTPVTTYPNVGDTSTTNVSAPLNNNCYYAGKPLLPWAPGYDPQCASLNLPVFDIYNIPTPEPVTQLFLVFCPDPNDGTQSVGTVGAGATLLCSVEADFATFVPTP